jgi:hypothetical protein
VRLWLCTRRFLVIENEQSVKENGRRERITIRLRPSGYGVTGQRASLRPSFSSPAIVNREGRERVECDKSAMLLTEPWVRK